MIIERLHKVTRGAAAVLLASSLSYLGHFSGSSGPAGANPLVAAAAAEIPHSSWDEERSSSKAQTDGQSLTGDQNSGTTAAADDHETGLYSNARGATRKRKNSATGQGKAGITAAADGNETGLYSNARGTAEKRKNSLRNGARAGTTAVAAGRETDLDAAASGKTRGGVRGSKKRKVEPDLSSEEALTLEESGLSPAQVDAMMRASADPGSGRWSAGADGGAALAAPGFSGAASASTKVGLSGLPALPH